MRRVILIIVCLVLVLSFAGCKNKGDSASTSTDANQSVPSIEDSQEAEQPEHYHSWSQPYCGTKQRCLTCGEETGEIVEHNYTSEVCMQNKVCLICGKTQFIDHNWSVAVCGENQTCLRCGEESDTIITHTTDEGYCDRCGEYYVSKERLIEKENARYENRKDELCNVYIEKYEEIENRAYTYYIKISYSESYIASKIASIDKERDVIIRNIATLSGGSPSANASQIKKLEEKLSELSTERAEYSMQQMYWDSYKECVEEIAALNDEYEKIFAEEDKVHQENLANINNQFN